KPAFCYTLCGRANRPAGSHETTPGDRTRASGSDELLRRRSSDGDGGGDDDAGHSLQGGRMSHRSSSEHRRSAVAAARPTVPSASTVRTLAELTHDPLNANRGTDRGRDALERSLREYGAGRAILIDRHGRIIAGNKTALEAKRLKLPLRVV